ncbi:MAG TPA: GIY-YIG nuclease family protein [Chromatiales bacterium]|nr:GIY-YIG nuclease family protein [Chromatiales bacterium]
MTIPLPDCAGTYVLLLEACRWHKLPIGRFGQLVLEPGCYLYVGSAFGPGGLRARVGRRLQRGKPLRWHIDYLREHTRLVAVWYACDEQVREAAWVGAVAGMGGITVPLPGFGATDHPGQTHLFHSRRCPRLREFEEQLQGRQVPPVQGWQVEA